MLTNLIFSLLEKFRNSDRTPPYIDTYLQLFPNFGNLEKNSPIRMSLSRLQHSPYMKAFHGSSTDYL